ncbi:hypothetical protein B0T17DRAFT_613373 [Bombardia bombarda]|uniref:Uncharacterized protein n=1 Tax=Bombardia bombarda TaxID=252184 RepID=A0AA39XMB2_9PEZI|nr:hypothetical protein B0T17DRAFT_613373 [Bombardia bombarda]
MSAPPNANESTTTPSQGSHLLPPGSGDVPVAEMLRQLRAVGGAIPPVQAYLRTWTGSLSNRDIIIARVEQLIEHGHHILQLKDVVAQMFRLSSQACQDAVSARLAQLADEREVAGKRPTCCDIEDETICGLMAEMAEIDKHMVEIGVVLETLLPFISPQQHAQSPSTKRDENKGGQDVTLGVWGMFF